MLRLLLLQLLLAGLRGLAAAGPGSQSSFLQIVFPEKLQRNTSDNSEEQISYLIPIDEKPYIVHLKRRYFLAENFVVYVYNQGNVNSDSSDVQPQCYYGGYVEGFPGSVATLTACSGLRGMLQFENVSYGIEPLESASKPQHILYKLGNEINEMGIFKENNRSRGKSMDYHIFISEKSESPAPNVIPLYLEMHIVVDKALYDYLGSDSTAITNKVMEMINLVNSVFIQFNVTIVLSSLELWSDKNKISTAGEADELLHRFLEWKQSYLALRPHDVAFLLIYRDYPKYVGAAFPGQMCAAYYSTGIALYSKDVTLEALSVIITQMLGLSLGISYDDPKKCQCPEAVCIMTPEAIQSSGVKTFSNCSLSDFESFISNVGARCLRNKPQMQRNPRPVCGDGMVEGSEECDCGNEKECGPKACCDHQKCVLKAGSECDRGPCCSQCRFIKAGTLCRPSQHLECDIPEYCNGSSGACVPDVFIQNGNLCKNKKFMCYNGDCHDTDDRCEKYFGKGSKNAPFACYEEIQVHTDNFGNCGKNKYNKYLFCGLRNLMCGRLICTYPSRTPYFQPDTAVIYAYVRNNICISVFNTSNSKKPDPFLVQSGAPCDTGRICVNRVCLESRFLRSSSQTCSQQCSGHGVCNSKGACNCTDGYLPPNCQSRSRGSSVSPAEKGKYLFCSDSPLVQFSTCYPHLKKDLIDVVRMEPDFVKDLVVARASGKASKSWLLSAYVGLTVLLGAAIVGIVLNRLKGRFSKQEEALSSRSTSEGSTDTYASRSRSESSNQSETSKSTSEDSTQANTSRSESQGSTQTHSSSH